MSPLDRLGTSTKRLALAFLAAAMLVVCGAIAPLEGTAVGPYAGTILSFSGGALFALAVASWQINASIRARAAAIDHYWKPFSDEAVICLSIRVEDQASPFTPYHDSVAGQRVQSYLEATFGKTIPIVSANDFDNLNGIRAKHVVLIGGPNHNHLTKEAMELLWSDCGDRYFQWPSGSTAASETSSPDADSHGYLLKVQFVGDEPRAEDTIHDLRDAEGNLIEARGMCLRLKGLQRRGSHLLVCAGADNAYGTLAAVEYVLTPENLHPLVGGDSQVIAGATLEGNQLDAPRCLRAICSD